MNWPSVSRERRRLSIGDESTDPRGSREHPRQMLGIESVADLRNPKTEIDEVEVDLPLRRSGLPSVPEAVDGCHRRASTPEIGELERVEVTVRRSPVRATGAKAERALERLRDLRPHVELLLPEQRIGAQPGELFRGGL